MPTLKIYIQLGLLFLFGTTQLFLSGLNVFVLNEYIQLGHIDAVLHCHTCRSFGLLFLSLCVRQESVLEHVEVYTVWGCSTLTNRWVPKLLLHFCRLSVRSTEQWTTEVWTTPSSDTFYNWLGIIIGVLSRTIVLTQVLSSLLGKLKHQFTCFHPLVLLQTYQFCFWANNGWI